jgi:LuxR family maltose regulon positive regulatory protein
MPTRLLATKFYIPQVTPELVSRPRLIERLKTGLLRKLTLISAPAGFGKTTVLSEWIHQSEGAESHVRPPVAWVSLDRGDNDPALFWAYFIAALQTIEENIGDSTLGALQSPQPPLIESILTTLINEIAAVPDHFTLVLEDYHLIESQAIHDALAFLLDHLPQQMHLVIATRADPPLPLALLRGRGQLTEIRAADLRFTLDETAAFLNEAMELDLSEEDIAALEARTEGWIASLHMAAASMQGRKDISDFIAALRESDRFVLDYLTEEVLQRLPPSTQSFLMETAILDRLTGPLCDAVTGGNNGQEILEQLEIFNLFVMPLDRDQHWYRYHRLFAELLRTQLSKSKPDLVSILHHRASDWFEAEGLTDEAIHHSSAAGDFARTANLIEPVVVAMAAQNRMATLLGWLAKLPDEVVAERPWLCVSGACANLFTGQLNAVEPLLQCAESRLSEGSQEQSVETIADHARIHGYVMTIRAFMAHSQGDIPRTIELSHEALGYLTDGDSVMRSSLALILGLACFASGEMASASQYLEEAAAISKAAGHIYTALTAICYLGDLQTRQGHLHQAAKIYQQALQLAAAWGNGQPLPAAGRAYVGLGQVFYEWNEVDRAALHLDQGIQLGEQAQEWSVALRGYLPMSWVKQSLGEANAAMDTLKRAESISHKAAMATEASQVPSWEVRLSLAQGNLAAAARWATSQKAELSLHDEPDYRIEFVYLTLVRVRIAQDEANEMPGLLEGWRQLAEEQERTGSVIEILILQALAFATLGNTDRAIAALEQALSLAEPEGHVRTFLNEGEPMVRLLHQAASRGIAPDYVRKLLAASQDSMLQREAHRKGVQIGPPVSVHKLEPLPLVEPLTMRELDMLRLIAAGLSNKQIAEELYLSVNTVKTHNKTLYSKLNVHSRIQATQRAGELALL